MTQEATFTSLKQVRVSHGRVSFTTPHPIETNSSQVKYRLDLKPSVKGSYGVRVSFTGYIVHVPPAGGGFPRGKRLGIHSTVRGRRARHLSCPVPRSSACVWLARLARSRHACQVSVPVPQNPFLSGISTANKQRRLLRRHGQRESPMRLRTRPLVVASSLRS